MRDPLTTLPQMPAWVVPHKAGCNADAAFMSGAALAVVHAVVQRDDVPLALLRARLALLAAEACCGFAGRPETAADLRDAVHFLRPGDLPGPAGAIYQDWNRISQRQISKSKLVDMFPQPLATQVQALLKRKNGAPVVRASAALETALAHDARLETTGLILADAVLAKAMGWPVVIPLFARGLASRDLQLRGVALETACHDAVVVAAQKTVPLAHGLARRVAALRAVTPKLRAKGAGAAVEMVLTRDAVAATALPLPDRAARRLCDRLVDLGVVHELTGRDTFRLYGV